MTILCVTGTRHGRPDVETTLDAWADAFGTPSLVVVGGDRNGSQRTHRGVDLQAYEHVKMRGWRGWACYADWDAGSGAGPERNGRMVAKAGPGAHLLAFPGESSRGTHDCMRRGRDEGLLCVEVKPGWLDVLREMDAAYRRVVDALRTPATATPAR